MTRNDSKKCQICGHIVLALNPYQAVCHACLNKKPICPCCEYELEGWSELDNEWYCENKHCSNYGGTEEEISS